MLSSHFIEDIFVKFYDQATLTGLDLQQQDQSAASSFYYVIVGDKELTQNQANFLLKLLQKYKIAALSLGLDYRDALQNPQWKKPFRVLDLSKKIFVEKDDKGVVWVCAKFPYQLKKEFDEEFEEKNGGWTMSDWNHERKLRQMPIYKCNLIQLYEFAKRHAFEIDDTFMIALAEVEEIWQNQDGVLPFSTILSGLVVLGNSSEETDKWFEEHSTGRIDNDLLLAKSMGYLYSEKPVTLAEKIASSSGNSFWIKHNQELLQLYKGIDGKVAIVLDRTGDTLEWLKTFINDADAQGIPRNEIRVCFRENKDNHTGINDWIKENNVGGPIEGARIIIFEFKPAKWLFKEQDDVKLLVTNNLYPATNSIAKDWFNSHPCVIYLGDIKPSEQRGQSIVEL